MAEKYDGLNIQIGYPEKSMDEEEKYVLSPWGCLMGVLMDYGIDTSHITPRMGEHMVNDFMQHMENAGYIRKVHEGEEHDKG